MIIGNFDFSSSNETYICAEVGINHNGSLSLAKSLIEISAKTGCNGVKFQKRTPEICVPDAQKNIERDTPWGRISYLEYKRKIEFNRSQMAELRDYAHTFSLDWFVSCWDNESVDEMLPLQPAALKIPSALITNKDFVFYNRDTALPIIWSTGMSTLDEVDKCYQWLKSVQNIVCHCNSSYPADPSELNLSFLTTMKTIYDKSIIGYSGHETSLLPSVISVVQGARYIERHITVDRTLWGSDHAASVEEHGLRRLVRDIRLLSLIMGKPEKILYDSELSARTKLRG